MIQKIAGVIAPILTPFNDDLSFNSGLYVEHAKWLLNNGIDYISPFGTTGEALSMSVEERLMAVDALIEGGIDPRRIMPGAGLCNFPETVKLCRHATQRDCLAVMVLPPFFYKNASDEGLFQYFSLLIERVNHPNLKICLYHIPALSGVGVSASLTARLASAFPNIVIAYKDSSGDFTHTKNIISHAPTLAVFPGSERFLKQGLADGATGCISATCNLNPQGIRAVYDAIVAGDDDIEKHNQAIVSFRDLIESYTPIPMTKAVLAKQRQQPAWVNVRPPLVPEIEHNVTKLFTSLQHHHSQILSLIG